MKAQILFCCFTPRWNGAALLCALCLLIAGQAEAQTYPSGRPRLKGPLSLSDAVRTGLRDNLMVLAAQADRNAAAAETGMARSQLLPQLSATTFLSLADETNILTTFPTNVMPTNYMVVPKQGLADQNLTLMLPLYTGGELQDSVHAAAAQEQAAALEVNDLKAEIALQVRQAYYGALLGAANVKVAQARLQADIELLHTTQALYTAGRDIEADVERVQAEQAAAQQMLTQAQNTQQKAQLDLKVALGVRLDSDIHLTSSLTFTPPTGTLPDQIAVAERSRPALLAAQARVTAARAQASAVSASKGPQIYGAAMADAFTSNMMGARTGYTLGVTVSIPLLDGGERRAEFARAHAQEARAKAALEEAQLQVDAEVQKAWLDIQTAERNYRAAQHGLHAAHAAYDVIAVRVQNQKSILLEQLDALTALTHARADLAQALYDHALAVARLQRAIGRSQSAS